MRTFEKFNAATDHKCPLCGTNDEIETVLIPIQGTEDGNNMQAVQVHSKCLQDNYLYNQDENVIYAVCQFKSK